MRIATLCTLALVAAAPAAAAQSLYMPRSIKNVYASGTRLLNGMPGPNFWQDHGQYRITITATPPDPNISGTE